MWAVLFVVGLPIAIRNGNGLNALLTMCALAGVLYVAFNIVRIPMLLLFALLALPRRVMIRDGSLVVRTPTAERECPLSECEWYLDTTREDTHLGFYLGKTSALIIRRPVEEEHSSIALCLEPDSRRRWVEYLERVGARNYLDEIRRDTADAERLNCAS